MPIQFDAHTRRRAALWLSIGAAILSIPVLHYALGRDGGFLYPLGFEDEITGTPLAWIVAILGALAYAIYGVKNIPGVARTWNEVSWLKLLALYAAGVAAIVEEAFFRRMVMDGLAPDSPGCTCSAGGASRPASSPTSSLPQRWSRG